MTSKFMALGFLTLSISCKPSKGALSAAAIEVGGMGLTLTEDQYLAKFGGMGMKCEPTNFTAQRRPKVPLNQWHMEDSKVSLPITRCAIDCAPDSQGGVTKSHEVTLYQGKPYRVRFRPCNDSITLAVTADTYSKKVGTPVEIVESGFSNGMMRDLDGFEIDLDRGHVMATANWPHVPGGKAAAQQALGLIEWSDVDRIQQMKAEIERQEAAGENATAQAAAKKVDL